MNKDHLQSIWKIMRENHLQVDENTNSEYLCTICTNILIEASSAPCGCRYCKTCITDYLKNENKMCPGNTEYCNDKLINIDCDIHIDQTANTRISRLIVKCPNMNCQTKVDIKSMETHLEMCEHRCVSCPFINIGCEDNSLKSDKINEHLLSEVHSHSKLLMEWVNISRNETALLRNDIDQLRLENYDLKEKMEGAENIIRELQKNEIKNSSQIDKLSEEMTELRNENILLKEELRDLQDEHRVEQASNLDLREKVDNQIQEIDQLKRDYQMKETRFDENLEIQQKNINVIDIKLNEVSLSRDDMKNKSNTMIQSIEDIQKSIEKLNYGDFVCKIDGWTQKRNQAKKGINQIIFSKPFFSFKNSYKMCLRVDPDGFGDGKGTHLSIFYCIKEGSFDEILQWPFKHDVQISLINQKTGLVHSSMILKYSDEADLIECFNKPITDQNDAFGYPKFIKLDEISTIPGLCENDQIVIKCSVKFL